MVGNWLKLKVNNNEYLLKYYGTIQETQHRNHVQDYKVKLFSCISVWVFFNLIFSNNICLGADMWHFEMKLLKC